MWGLKMERFSTPKVLAVGPNLHNACTLLCDRRSNKQKDVDKCKCVLSTAAPPCIAGMQKKRKRKRKKTKVGTGFRYTKYRILLQIPEMKCYHSGLI
jgi:hypothetical protein